MALSFANATGNIFNRLGRIFAVIRNNNGVRGSTATDVTAKWGAGGPLVKDLFTEIDDIKNQFQAGTVEERAIIDELFSIRSSYVSALKKLNADMQILAQNTLIEQVYADASANLTAKDKASAMKELIRQMIAGSANVTKSTSSVSVATGVHPNNSANVGNATITSSVTGTDGLVRQHVLPENLRVRVTSDSLTGGRTAGSETLGIVGEPAETDQLSQAWPLGSAASTTITMADAAVDVSTNYLVNGNFENFTANTPNSWTVLVGTPGTDIIKSTTVFYRGTASLSFVGGATAASIVQSFAQTSTTLGSTITLKPNTVYAINCYIKCDVVPIAGVLAIELVDSTNTVINNDQAVANSVTKTLSTATTSFTALNGFFQTPANLPATHKLRVRLSTAMSAGSILYIDDLCFIAPVEAYTGGPFVGAFRGSTDAILDDTWNITVANDNAGVFLTMFDRVYGMKALGMQLPTAASGSIADSLVA